MTPEQARAHLLAAAARHDVDRPTREAIDVVLSALTDAEARRTEGGPITGRRIPGPPGQWANRPIDPPPSARQAPWDRPDPEG